MVIFNSYVKLPEGSFGTKEAIAELEMESQKDDACYPNSDWSDKACEVLHFHSGRYPLNFYQFYGWYNVEAKPLGPTSLRKRVEIADTGGDVLLFLQKPDVDPKLRIV